MRALLPWLMVACVHQAPTLASPTGPSQPQTEPTAPPEPGLSIPWIVIPTHVRFTEDYLSSDGSLETAATEEHWVLVNASSTRQTYRSEAVAHYPGRTETTSAVYVLDRDGYGWTETSLPDGRYDTTGARKVEMPHDPRPGLPWSAIHDSIAGSVRRTCRLDAESVICPDGLVALCRTSRDGVDAVIQSHYCPGTGLRAQEASVWTDGALKMSYRSYGYVIDGVPYPDVDPALLAVPAPDAIPHPAPPP